MTNKYSKYTELSMDISVSILSVFFSIIARSFNAPLVIIGIFIVILSLYLLIKVRRDSLLLILFGIIAYVNFSVVAGELFQTHQTLPNNTLAWQEPLRNSWYNYESALSIVIFMATLNVVLNTPFLKKITIDNHINIVKNNNNYIFWIGFIVLILFWGFGYSTTAGVTYESNTRTIYEYSLLLFIVVWFYSGKSPIKTFLLNTYGLFYILQALLMGDRSSAFPMVVLLVLTNGVKIKLKHIILLGSLGALFSNIVSVYRISFSLSDVSKLFEYDKILSVFLSNTVSQSYYTAISIIASRDIVTNPIKYFFDFLGGIFLGGSFRNADVGALSNTIYFNRGGGFYFSWFYFWFGILGVLLSAVILGGVIKYLYLSNKNYLKLYQIAVVVMSFRWYLYTSFVFYRSILFVFSLLVIISIIVNKSTKRTVERKEFLL